jgi:hypothetical protein
MSMRRNETTRAYFDKLATISPPDKCGALSRPEQAST